MYSCHARWFAHYTFFSGYKNKENSIGGQAIIACTPLVVIEEMGQRALNQNPASPQIARPMPIYAQNHR